MHRKYLTVAVAALTLTVSGCNTTKDGSMFTKENIGTVVGTGAGLLVGSQLGSGSGRQVAMLVGSISGGLLGRYIGAELDERDRQAIEQQSAVVLEQNEDGQVTQWRSDHTDTTATITPVNTSEKTQESTIKTSSKLSSVEKITPINVPYQTTSGVNIRNSPSTKAERVGSLAEGTTFTAIGKTDNDWLVVSRQGVGVGYLYAPLATEFTNQQVAANKAVDLDSIKIEKDDSTMAGFDLDNVEVTNQTVAYTSKCRTLQYDIDSEGDSSSSEVEACQSADGSWELV